MTNLIGETITKNESAVNSASKTRNWIKTSNKLCESGVFDAYGLKKDWYGIVETIKMGDDGRVNIRINIRNGNSVKQYYIKESLIDIVLEIPTKSMVKFSGYFIKGNMSENECLSGGSLSSPDMIDEPFWFKFTDVTPYNVENNVENVINRVGKDGKKEGVWIKYYWSGKLKSKGNYKDDKLEGEFLRYWKNGQLKYKWNYKDGKEEGELLWYYENGNIWFKKNYKNAELDGELLNYDKNGKLWKKRNYKDGKQDGEDLWYYNNGQIRYKTFYKDDKKEGEQLDYNENGKLEKTRIYKDGKVIKIIKH